MHSLLQIIGTGRGRSYVYSAYLDDRPTARDVPNSSHLPVIRVFGYIPLKVQPTQSWKCLLWYPHNGNAPVVTDVYALTYMDVDYELRYIYTSFIHHKGS